MTVIVELQTLLWVYYDSAGEVNIEFSFLL